MFLPGMNKSPLDSAEVAAYLDRLRHLWERGAEVACLLSARTSTIVRRYLRQAYFLHLVNKPLYASKLQRLLRCLRGGHLQGCPSCHGGGGRGGSSRGGTEEGGDSELEEGSLQSLKQDLLVAQGTGVHLAGEAARLDGMSNSASGSQLAVGDRPIVGGPSSTWSSSNLSVRAAASPAHAHAHALPPSGPSGFPPAYPNPGGAHFMYSGELFRFNTEPSSSLAAVAAEVAAIHGPAASSFPRQNHSGTVGRVPQEAQVALSLRPSFSFAGEALLVSGIHHGVGITSSTVGGLPDSLTEPYDSGPLSNSGNWGSGPNHLYPPPLGGGGTFPHYSSQPMMPSTAFPGLPSSFPGPYRSGGARSSGSLVRAKSDKEAILQSLAERHDEGEEGTVSNSLSQEGSAGGVNHHVPSTAKVHHQHHHSAPALNPPGVSLLDDFPHPETLPPLEHPPNWTSFPSSPSPSPSPPPAATSFQGSPQGVMPSLTFNENYGPVEGAPSPQPSLIDTPLASQFTQSSPAVLALHHWVEALPPPVPSPNHKSPLSRQLSSSPSQFASWQQKKYQQEVPLRRVASLSPPVHSSAIPQHSSSISPEVSTPSVHPLHSPLVKPAAANGLISGEAQPEVKRAEAAVPEKTEKVNQGEKTTKRRFPRSHTQPIPRSESPGEEELAAGQKAPLHGLHILVAEDTPVLRRLAVVMLEKLGASVEAVNDGQAALETVTAGMNLAEGEKSKERPKEPKGKKFDAVIMDCQMPRLDGYSATEKIRAAEKVTGTHLPIIALTAHAMASDKERCLACGMDAYLTKPANKALLVETIHQFVKPKHVEGPK